MVSAEKIHPLTKRLISSKVIGQDDRTIYSYTYSSEDSEEEEIEESEEKARSV